MGGGHGLSGSLYVPGSSPVHRLAPQCKLAATVLFVFAVVSTPREAFWAFGCYAAVLVALVTIAELPPSLVLRRLAIELPFVAFALLLPVVGQGERVDVLGLSLSVAGLWGAWNILAKATIGVAASVVLSSTTPIAEILHGLDHLHVPKVFVSICAFMIRYGDVISAEMQRMRIARESRGHDPRWIWQARAVASSAGALFIRSYERGERVYLAMVSRGYRGSMPVASHRAATQRDWLRALSVPAVAAVVSLTAWMLR
jgi:cobalt/nickel transport system permease protein